ncbi:5' nucleotidase, NT5C type [Chitinophaga nivalis]|uniref:5'(3')-deoxyribonucleotidase n=1 Tax=Chitinophaga nivalis TaxID=2991709 RepID=A0ABT3IVR6_9BACT|nr:5'(3')-deoxyribonucleotidase [Chitinophaga nivalis]MCW3462227.1 5'(3')-deoxyribonucleotidase [Chitinophaga nivalis]MCW3488081.1 5'(3')-deoxyribonucleotidase [Chitinophaga nivalis]
MARIAIDMDNVMADLTTHYLNYYEAAYGVKVDPATLKGIPEGSGFPEKDAILGFLHSPGFFRTAPVIAGSQEVIKALSEKHEIFIVSAAMEFPLSLAEKLAWLQEHFPFISWRNIVFCGSKTIVDADYMIDDHDKNLRYFKGVPLLFTAPHNALLTDYKRVNTWQEVAAYFALDTVTAI